MDVHVIVKQDEFKITVNLILISWMKTARDVCPFAFYKKIKKRKKQKHVFLPNMAMARLQKFGMNFSTGVKAE